MAKKNKKKSRHSSVNIVAAVIFALIALAHLARIVVRLPVEIGIWSVPVWVSWIPVVLGIVMAVWLRKTAE
jgi:hypothetical protein